MAVMDGCESQRRTAVLEDRICPKCGKEVEVFTTEEGLPNPQNVPADMCSRRKRQFL